jgi:FtsP/CotA-like multicopper oxidase with cupredoxin domain
VGRAVWSILIVLVVVARAASTPAAGERFVTEFDAALPAEAPPTASVRDFEIVAQPTRIPLLDGRSIDVWAYGGTVPGPTLRVRSGEGLRVRLVNRLPQETTIHWHGVRVPNAMDGVPGVTQPPVRPGETFTYEFTPKDSGTYWFHSHHRSSEQVERGLYGVLIVEDADPLPWSQDVVWVIDDWLVTAAGEIDAKFNTRRDLAFDGRWGNVMTVNGQTGSELAVDPGDRIRLRLLNPANGRVFRLDLGGLEARAIAVDGPYASAPFDPREFELAPGNRLDLDVTIRAADRGKRFIVSDVFTSTPQPLATVVVRDVAPVPTPEFASPARARVPRWDGGEREPVALEYALDTRRGGEFGIEWTLNGEAFPARPAPLPLGKFSRLRFVNHSARLHPMHLHGQFFRLLARNGKRVEEGHWRDTVLVHAEETVDVGLVALDPGTWMMHCHVLEHAEAGMMALVQVGEAAAPVAPHRAH